MLNEPVTIEQFGWKADGGPHLEEPFANLNVDGPIQNMQIALWHDILYAVAVDGNGQFQVIKAHWNIATRELGLWELVPADPSMSLPIGTMPYDLKTWSKYSQHDPIGEEPRHVLMVATDHGFYYSNNGGGAWIDGNAGPGNSITAPNLRRIAIDLESYSSDGSGNGANRIIVGGLDATYEGLLNPDEYSKVESVTWHEFDYAPTSYQHWNRAWTSISLPMTLGGVNLALVDHSADPNLSDPTAVVVQVEAAGRRTTVDLGRLLPATAGQGQVAGTTPRMFRHNGTGDPYVVFTANGTHGAVVIAPDGTDYSHWALADYLGEHAANQTVPISDVTTSPDVDYVMMDNRALGGHTYQLWANRENGWTEMTCSGLGNEMLSGEIAATPSNLYYCYGSAGDVVLYKSTDAGNNFSAVLNGSWAGLETPRCAVAWDDQAPVYVAGTNTGTNDGRVIRYDPGTGQSISRSLSYNAISEIVSDPYDPDRIYVAAYDHANNRACLLQISYDPLQNRLVGAKLWTSVGSHQSEYAIRDLQLYPESMAARVLTMTLSTPNFDAGDVDHTVVKRLMFNVTGRHLPLPPSVNGDWLLAGDVTIPVNETVNVDDGAQFYCMPGARLIVNGTLLAGNDELKPIRFQRLAEDQEEPWAGIEVHNSATLNYCQVTGSENGIYVEKAQALTLNKCNLDNNGNGIFIGTPEGTHVIHGTTIAHSSRDGVALIAARDVVIDSCQFIENGGSGIALTDAYATLTDNYFQGNAKFGVDCYASSPVLYCNNFENDLIGELLLVKGSSPVLWEDKDQKGGANRFLNDAQTLIILIDSDPLLQEGKNNFYVGQGAYFMADQSPNPMFTHKLDGNYWNPDIDLDLFNPPDPNLWVWGSVADPGECGELMNPLAGSAATLFKQGYDARDERPEPDGSAALPAGNRPVSCD